MSGSPPTVFSIRKTRPMFKKAIIYQNSENTELKGFILADLVIFYNWFRYCKLRIILSKKVKLP
jgi:hypothetical protein